MKRFLLLFMIIATIFFVTACRKITQKTDVSGNVYDMTSGAPIAHAHVSLMEKDQTALGGGGRTSTAEDTYTDSNGKFSFDFKAERAEEIEYSVQATDDKHEVSGVPVDKFKETDNVKILLKRSSFLKIHIKNTSPFDANDAIGVITSHDTWPPPYNYTGTTVDTYVISQERGDDSVLVAWYVNKNGINTNSGIKLYCPAFDTTTYNLNY